MLVFLLNNLYLLLPMAFLLAASACFSSAETALFSLSAMHVSRMKKSGNRLQLAAAALVEKPRSVLITLLLGNMTINVLIFVLSTVLLKRVGTRFGGGAVAALSLLPVILVTYAGEVLPKVVSQTLAVRLAPLVAVPVGALMRLLWPLVRAIQVGVMTPLHRLVGGRPGNSSFSTGELRELLEMSEHQGVIDVSENELLQQVVRLADLRVRDVMTPRVDVVAFNIKDGPEKLLALIRQSQLTKLPVFEGQVDNLLGVVYAKTVLLEAEPARVDVRKLLRPVRFVAEFATLEQLLVQFRQQKSQMAIAVDEYGGMVGLVTLEDAVEQMVGEIYTPREQAVNAVLKVGDDDYRVAGDLSVADWSEAFGARVEASGTTTVAGLLADALKRIPREGDRVRLNHLEMTVEKMRGRRVETVRLRVVEGP